VTLAAYWRVATLDFVDLDDFGYVVENPHVLRGLTADSIAWAFTSEHLGYWAPVLWLSYMIDAEISGVEAAGYHITNLALHLANALLLFGLLQRTTQSLWASSFVALVFAVHPLNVESVAWVTERKNVLSTLFWLLSIWSYLSYVRHGRVASYALTACFMTLGLMAKATLVALPLVLLLLDFWPLQRLFPVGLSRGAEDRQRRGVPEQRPWRRALLLLIEKLPLLALSAAASLVTYLAQRNVGAMTGATQLSLGPRVENALVSYLLYMRKLLWPENLTALYPYPSLLGSEMWHFGQVAVSALLLAAMTVMAIQTGHGGSSHVCSDDRFASDHRLGRCRSARRIPVSKRGFGDGNGACRSRVHGLYLVAGRALAEQLDAFRTGGRRDRRQLGGAQQRGMAASCVS
jgi:hypothetical protein